MLPAKRIVSFEDKQTESRVHLPRYTVLQIKDIRLSPPGSLAILSLEDNDGAIYELETDLKYDVIVRNENYIEDFSDSKIYIKISGYHRKSLADYLPGRSGDGHEYSGMSFIHWRSDRNRAEKDNRFETWFYNGKTLEFENGTLQRYK